MTRKFAGREVTQEWISVEDLTVDPAYQRDLRDHSIRKWVRDFDPDAVGVLLVSRRSSGRNILMDGHHRREVVRLALGDAQKVPCHVYHGLTREEESALFLKYNDDVAVRPFDKFRARLVYGDPVAVAINTVVEASGFELVDGGGSPKTIRAVNALETIFTKAGPEVLAASLDIARRAGLADEDACNGEVLQGIGRFIARYPEADHARVVQRLVETPQNVLLARARMMKAQVGGWRLSQLIGQEILRMYNKGVRSRQLVGWSENDNEAWKPAKTE